MERMELADKIRAVIDETEQIARACDATDWRIPHQWQIVDRDYDGWQNEPDDAVIFTICNARDAEGIHAINHDPDRVLRRCAADRKILDLYADYREKVSVKAEDNDHWWHQAGEGAAYFRVLHLLAETYGIEP